MKGEGEVIKNCYGSMYVSVEQQEYESDEPDPDTWVNPRLSAYHLHTALEISHAK